MDTALVKSIMEKVKGLRPLNAEEVALIEKVSGKPYTGPREPTKGPKAAKELTAEADALEKRLKGASGSSGSTEEWARLAKLRAEAKEAEAADRAKAPPTTAPAPAPIPLPAKPKGPIPMEGGPLPAKPAPVAPATGVRPQPMAAPMPSKAGPVQAASPVSGPGVPIGVTAPVPSLPPPPMGAAPGVPEGQAGGESPPEARAFWDYLQKIQGKGDLVAENPMYTKAFDDATPDEKARLIKENPLYFEKFRSEMDLGTPGTKYADKDLPDNPVGKRGPGGAAAGGGGPLDPAAPKFAEAAAGVPEWLTRLGEVLQAGLAGAHGETDIGKTAYGRRVAEAAKKSEAEDEKALMEKWKNIERGWTVEDRDAAAAIERERSAREEALVKAGWSVEDARAAAERSAAFARMKYQTDAEAALAGKETGAGLDWKTRAYGEVGE